MISVPDAWGFPDVLSSGTVLLLLATVGAVIYLLYKQLCDEDNWEKYGVKHGFIGITDFRTKCIKLMEQYGDTIGVKNYHMELVTRDLEILKIVMVKDFNNFADRQTVVNTNSIIRKGIFFLRGDNWRRIRHVLSPSFSSGKLKHTAKTIDETARKLASVLEGHARAGKLVQVKDRTGQYSSEVIAKTAFGLQTDCLDNDDDEFTYYCQNIFKHYNNYMLKFMLIFIRFPGLHRILVQTFKIGLLDSFSSDSARYLTSIVRRSLVEREKYENAGKEKPKDLLQSLVSAKVAGDRIEADAAKGADNSTTEPHDKIPKTMTEDELIAQSVIFIFAGFETMSTSLQMCLYMLAKYPDTQEKVYEEIQSVVSGDSPTNEELQRLHYMEQVINETLRLYPPVPIVNRKAAETKTYGNITIPKGAGVLIPIFLVLKNPKYFPDPEKFDPDRFTEENKDKRDPMAFMPFGYGPRLCLGMRLAYLELKIALVHVLRKVTFELNDRTVPKLGEDLKININFHIQPEAPITLYVRPRNI